MTNKKQGDNDRINPSREKKKDKKRTVHIFAQHQEYTFKLLYVILYLKVNFMSLI